MGEATEVPQLMGGGLEGKIRALLERTSSPRPPVSMTDAAIIDIREARSKLMQGMRERRNQEQELQRRTEHREKIASERLSRVPKRFRAASPNTIAPTDWRLIESALAQEGSGLFIHGPVGTGKSYLAAAALLHGIGRNPDVWSDEIFCSASQLLMELRSSFNKDSGQSESGIIDDFSRASMIVLDDLGAEKTTDYALQSLYIIIDRRYTAMLPTIITSNLTLGEIAEKIGDRLASRIVEMCQVIELKGEDRRLVAI